MAVGQARGSWARPHLHGNNLAGAWGRTARRAPGSHCPLLARGGGGPGWPASPPGPTGRAGLQPHPVQTHTHSAALGGRLAPRGACLGTPGWGGGGLQDTRVLTPRTHLALPGWHQPWPRVGARGAHSPVPPTRPSPLSSPRWGPVPPGRVQRPARSPAPSGPGARRGRLT